MDLTVTEDMVGHKLGEFVPYVIPPGTIVTGLFSFWFSGMVAN